MNSAEHFWEQVQRALDERRDPRLDEAVQEGIVEDPDRFGELQSMLDALGRLPQTTPCPLLEQVRADGAASIRPRHGPIRRIAIAMAASFRQPPQPAPWIPGDAAESLRPQHGSIRRLAMATAAAIRELHRPEHRSADGAADSVRPKHGSIRRIDIATAALIGELHRPEHRSADGAAASIPLPRRIAIAVAASIAVILGLVWLEHRPDVAPAASSALQERVIRFEWEVGTQTPTRSTSTVIDSRGLTAKAEYRDDPQQRTTWTTESTRPRYP